MEFVFNYFNFTSIIKEEKMKKILSAFFAAGILMSPMAIQAEDIKDAVVDAAKEAVADAVAEAAAPKVEGDCIVHYVRTACEGQEETSYKKCDGQQECDKAKEAASVEECQAAALKSLDITKSKVITATYKGEAIKPDAESDNMDFCLNYENREAEYNQCPEDQAAAEAAPAEEK